MPNKKRKTYGIHSPVAYALDIIGDRWTLLIIQQLLRGVNRYQDLQEALKSVSTNLLADRLNTLVDEGLAVKSRYSENPPRDEYHLTEQGQTLAVVVNALFEWGMQWREWLNEKFDALPEEDFSRPTQFEPPEPHRVEWL